MYRKNKNFGNQLGCRVDKRKHIHPCYAGGTPALLPRRGIVFIGPGRSLARQFSSSKIGITARMFERDFLG
uniref:Uncharacterized protein n=1 Tax=Candidatus Kentrum sp. SD TaxID=2126332 RepID=A0A450Y4Q0_9GAMM|nr:MAG: hypothetical protein BECKSD772F_GA0070984_100252 [Candidatus Kentron sp. SD]VFK39224.1 MAG: hypothetical protein BECKSD772E_GA0070983_100250 [Candidatus Kentron sp. SD]